MTIKIIQITDLHLNKDKEFMSHGINTFRSAKKIINEILVKERNVNCMILSGDLVDDGTSKGYENLSELLAEFSFPIYLMCGNHDSVENLKNICITKKLYFKSFISTIKKRCDTPKMEMDKGVPFVTKRPPIN